MPLAVCRFSGLRITPCGENVSPGRDFERFRNSKRRGDQMLPPARICVAKCGQYFDARFQILTPVVFRGYVSELPAWAHQALLSARLPPLHGNYRPGGFRHGHRQAIVCTIAFISFLLCLG